MECQVAQEILQFYVDGELDEDDRRELEDHLAQCGTCRTRADYERRFKAAIRARVPLEPAPASLRAQVEQVMDERPAVRRLPRTLAWGALPAAAALAMVVTFTWTVTSGFSPLVDEAVSRHSSEPPVEVSSHDSAEVENWFKSKVDFNVTLPRFQSRQLSLVGARLSNLAERQAALVRYQQGGRRFSLFVVTDGGEDLSASQCQRVHHREFCLQERRGYTVIWWRSRGLLYSMVGDAGPADLLSVLSSTSED